MLVGLIPHVLLAEPSNWKPQTGNSMYVERVEDSRKEDGKELLPRVVKENNNKM